MNRKRGSRLWRAPCGVYGTRACSCGTPLPSALPLRAPCSRKYRLSGTHEQQPLVEGLQHAPPAAQQGKACACTVSAVTYVETQPALSSARFASTGETRSGRSRPSSPGLRPLSANQPREPRLLGQVGLVFNIGRHSEEAARRHQRVEHGRVGEVRLALRRQAEHVAAVEGEAAHLLDEEGAVAQRVDAPQQREACVYVQTQRKWRVAARPLGWTGGGGSLLTGAEGSPAPSDAARMPPEEPLVASYGLAKTAIN